MFDWIRWLKVKRKMRAHNKMKQDFFKTIRDNVQESKTRGGTTLIKYKDGSGRVVTEGGHCADCGHFPCSHAYQRRNKEGLWEWVFR